ncbi:hypothetical protein HPB47_014341 [Ixodes persulcatus]|uniref:Uncharacterized protein n=1 Tax=Ixodes persulcatus TaxID=34615 RepID=A0AC60R3M0_IXOPE|nr:hypothetical protein HPB47_014341 [Ixodes persulcatus]
MERRPAVKPLMRVDDQLHSSVSDRNRLKNWSCLIRAYSAAKYYPAQQRARTCGYNMRLCTTGLSETPPVQLSGMRKPALPIVKLIITVRRVRVTRSGQSAHRRQPGGEQCTGRLDKEFGSGEGGPSVGFFRYDGKRRCYAMRGKWFCSRPVVQSDAVNFEKWDRAIPRADKSLQPNSAVCERHLDMR